MKTVAAFLLTLLLATPAVAQFGHGTARPIAIDVTADADSFRVTNSGPYGWAEIHRSGDFLPGKWANFAAPMPTGTIQVDFVDTGDSWFNLGSSSAPIENGTFTGWTVPEPSTWALIVAGLVAWKRRTNQRVRA